MLAAIGCIILFQLSYHVTDFVCLLWNPTPLPAPPSQRLNFWFRTNSKRNMAKVRTYELGGDNEKSTNAIRGKLK